MSNPKPEQTSQWQQFESTIAAQCGRFFPDAIISRNERVRGQKSGELREIDIVIRQKLGLQEILIAVDCKHYGRPVDIKTMEAFCALKDDVAANAGIVIAKSGFTKSSLKVARNNQVTTYRYVDGDAAEFPDWIWMPLMLNIWWLQPKLLVLKKPDGKIERLNWRDELKVSMNGETHAVPIRSAMLHAWSLEKTDKEGEYPIGIDFLHQNEDLNHRVTVVYSAKKISAVRRAKLIFSGFADQDRKKVHSTAYKIQADSPARLVKSGGKRLGKKSGTVFHISTVLAYSHLRNEEALVRLFLKGILELTVSSSSAVEWSLPELPEKDLLKEVCQTGTDSHAENVRRVPSRKG